MTNVCTICRAGAVLLASVRPEQRATTPTGGDDGPASSSPSALIPDLSCGELQSAASDRWDANDAACDAWRVAFSDVCCYERERERGSGNGDGDKSASPRRRAQKDNSLAENAVNMAEAAASEFEVDADGTPTVTNVASAVPVYACEQSVRSFLLGDDSEYSTTTAPVTSPSTPVNVSTSISFYHATELSTLAGTAELFFGFILRWNDERLAWNPSDFGGCDAFSARASLDAEKTEIWVPNLDLINHAVGVQALPDAMADVSSTGDVEWYRTGGVKAICFFEGLERFPYDELECEFTFGSPRTILSAKDPVKYIPNEDVLFPETSNVAKYQEYTVMPEKTTISYDEDNNVIDILFTFERASKFYTSTIVVPTIIFTFVSFGMFLLDIRVGERLAFGVSLLLVIVANAILTADMLPTCKERIWVTVLTTASYYWIIAAVLESIAVAYLYFLETEDLEAKRQNAEEQNSGTASVEEEKREMDKEARDRAVGGSFGCISSGGNSTGNGSIGLPLTRRTNSMEDSCHEESSPSENEGHAEDEGHRPTVRKRMKWQGTIGRTLGNILFANPRPSRTWRMRAIRRMDRFCAFVFPVSYIIFFSTLIARNKYW